MRDGIDVAQLKVYICSHPAVEAIFQGGLLPSAIQLRIDKKVLRNNVRVWAGQTVHLCSGKGQETKEADEDGVAVYYGADEDLYLMVPRGESLAKWTCAQLGLDPTKHWVSLRYGRYVLKSEKPEPEPEPRPTPTINNNNNITEAVIPFLKPPEAVLPPPCPKKEEEPDRKWERSDEAEILMPNGSTFAFKLAPCGDDAIYAVMSACSLYRLGPAKYYQLQYFVSPIVALHVLPGVRYRLVHK
jgi:hypothetical protein